MPRPSSKGPNMCPVGNMGAIEMDTPPRWHCATEALSLAYAYDGLVTEDFDTGTYPQDLGAILAFEV